MVSAASETEFLISAKDISFGYGGLPVLLDVSLSIKRKDFLAVIGPNGSGKTTFIKILLGLLKPDKGSVTLMGRELSRFREWRRIGYIPQKASHIDPFFPATVREVVSMSLFSGKERNTKAGRLSSSSAVIDVLRQVGMEHLAKTPIGALSGGQQQRVFIARALVAQPDILFLDEPTTGVDASTQDRFYGLLAELNMNKGLTIVLVTHDIGIVNKHVQSVACLNQRLVYHGNHEEFCRSQALKDMLAGGHHLVSHEH